MTAETPRTAAGQDGPNVRKLTAADATSVTLVRVPPADPHSVFEEVWHVPTRVVRVIEAKARAVAEARERVLTERVETEWYNGNIDEAAHDRILALGPLLAESPAAAKTDVEPSRLVAEWLTVERLVIALHRLAPPTHFVGSGINTHICLGAAGHIETATALRDALLREGGAS